MGYNISIFIKIFIQKEVQNLRDNLIEAAQNNLDVIGLFSTGSCGKGLITDESDFDTTMVVKNEALDAYRKKYKGFGSIFCDLTVKTLSELRETAAWGRPMAWDRYNYTHLKVEVDKKIKK